MDFQIISCICSSLFIFQMAVGIQLLLLIVITLSASPKFRLLFFNFRKVWIYPTSPILWLLTLIRMNQTKTLRGLWKSSKLGVTPGKLAFNFFPKYTKFPLKKTLIKTCPQQVTLSQFFRQNVHGHSVRNIGAALPWI